MHDLPGVRNRLAVVVVGGMLAGLSCSDGGGVSDPPPGPGPDPTVSISLGSTSVTLAQGDSAVVTITIVRGGGFSGAVQLGLEGAPQGVTGRFDPSPVPAGAASSTLTLTAAPSSSVGSFQIAVRASAPGVPAHSASLTLGVEAVAAYALSVEPAALTLTRGLAAVAAIRIERTHFDGPISFSVAGLPVGLTADISPDPATGDEATLTLSASAGAPLGDLAITLTGHADGLEDRTAPVALTIQDPAGPSDVRWGFCPSAAPSWLAFQDRDGPWTQLAASPASTTEIPIDEVGAVAFADIHTGARRIVVLYATAAELNALGSDWCASYGGGKNVRGTAVGLEDGDHAYIILGLAGDYVPASHPDFRLNALADGPRDLIASRLKPLNVADRFLFRRAIDPPDGATIDAVDFDGPEAFEPVHRTVTIGQLGSDLGNVSLAYRTANGTAGLLYGAYTHTRTGIDSFPAVPPARQQPGDLHILYVDGRAPSLGTDFESRTVAFAFRDATDREVTLGPHLAATTVTQVATSPYLRLRAQLASQPEYGDQVVLAMAQQNASMTVIATAGYLGGRPPTWDLTVPDLTGAGLDPALAPQPGGTFHMSMVQAFGWGGGGLAEPAHDGAIVRYAVRVDLSQVFGERPPVPRPTWVLPHRPWPRPGR